MASLALAFDILAKDRASKTLNDVGNSADRLGTKADGVGSKFAKFGKVAGLAIAAVGAAAAGAAVVGLKGAIQAASDLGETTSKIQQVFGPAGDAVLKFADDSATALGQTRQQALDGAATFGIFGKAAGLSGGDLSKFSTDFTGLASDLASFNNTSPEDAINAIGSALRGESEPLRSYGVLLDDATLRQEALALGLVKTTKDALTPQQKVLAAQAAIYKQTKDAQGDFARTSGGLANQQRILSAQLENVKAKIGAGLLPVVTRLVTFLNGTAFTAVGAFFSALKEGDVTSDGLVGKFETIGDAIHQVLPDIQALAERAKALALQVLPVLGNYLSGALIPTFKALFGIVKNNILPLFAAIATFVVTKVLPAVVSLASALLGGLRGALKTLSKAIEDNRPGLENLLKGFRTVAGFLLTVLVPVVKVALTAAFGILGPAIKLVITILGTLGEIIGSVARGVLSFVGVFLEGLSDIFKVAGKLPLGLGQPFRDAQKAIDGAKESIDGLKRSLDKVDATTTRVRLAYDVTGNTAGSKTPRVNTGKFASGGFARGVALVGERGPEFVDFGASGARVRSNVESRSMASQGGDIVIQLDGREIARAVAPHAAAESARYARRG